MRRARPALLAAVVLAGCTAEVPPCPYRGTPEYAPSAGCLVLDGDRVLLVEDRLGRLSPPGGSTRPGESAQCTAFRESWEETGLALLPVVRLARFDTGFYLYHCELIEQHLLDDYSPSEVQRALWLQVDRLNQQRWRFPGQGETLRKLIEQLPQ